MAVLNARALLQKLAELDAAIHMRGDDGLMIQAPAGALTPELKAELTANKAEILAHMHAARQAHAHPCGCCGKFFYREPAVTCYWCRRSETAAKVPRRPEVEHGGS